MRSAARSGTVDDEREGMDDGGSILVGVRPADECEVDMATGRGMVRAPG
jgi:hypothetical protein